MLFALGTSALPLADGVADESRAGIVPDNPLHSRHCNMDVQVPRSTGMCESGHPWRSDARADESGDGDDWVLVKTSDDGAIRVHQRDSPDGYREFRAVTRVDSTLGGLIVMFTDVGNMPHWVYRTKEVRRLAVIGDREIYAYTVIGMPWPFYDRDAVLHILTAQNPCTHTVTIRIESVSGYYPRQQNRVRMPVVKSTWTLTPVSEGIVEVTFQGYGDPGGSLSSAFFRWFYDLASWEAPLSTLAGLRARIIREELRNRRVGYITEHP